MSLLLLQYELKEEEYLTFQHIFCYELCQKYFLQV